MARNPITNQVKPASFASLLRESDKGCVLLAVGIFDKILQNILEAAILVNLRNKPPKDFLAVSILGDNGTLHTFSAKINICYAFKLITAKEYKALHLLRKLRNEAAHSYFEFTLRDVGVAAHLNKLEKYELKKYRQIFARHANTNSSETDTEKLDFVVRCYGILMDLQNAMLKQLERYMKARGIKVERPAGQPVLT